MPVLGKPCRAIAVSATKSEKSKEHNIQNGDDKYTINSPYKAGLRSALTTPSQQVVLWPQKGAQVDSQQPLTTAHNMFWELKSFLL